MEEKNHPSNIFIVGKLQPEKKEASISFSDTLAAEAKANQQKIERDINLFKKMEIGETRYINLKMALHIVGCKINRLDKANFCLSDLRIFARGRDKASDFSASIVTKNFKNIQAGMEKLKMGKEFKMKR